MRSFWFAVLLLLSVGAGLLGCDTTATQPESQVAVEAYLRAQAPLPAVQLTRTVEATETFDPRDQAVEGASVTVQRLDDEGSVVETTAYDATDTPGIYAPEPSSPPTVKPEATYRLTVDTGEDALITSTTTVPDTLSILAVENTREGPNSTVDTAAFQTDAQQPALTVTAQEDPLFDRQSVYLFTVTSRPSGGDLVEEDLTPFYCDSYDAEEDSLESFRVNSSGLLNEANFDRSNGTLTVDLPWLGVAFFGPNDVAINVVGENYYDFLRSTSAQEMAPPGEFPNIIEHVENGTGIFGSYAQAAVTIDFTRGEKFRGDAFPGGEYRCVDR